MADSTVPASARPRGRRRRWLLTFGLGVLVLGLLWFAPWHTANPVTITGTAHANVDATAIGFNADSRVRAMRWGLSPDGEGFVVAGVWWTDAQGTTHLDGDPPACLAPGESTRVEVSFVRLRYWGGDGGPTRVVTGLRCLA